MITPMSQNDYTNLHFGSRCPVCQSDEIHAEAFDAEGSQAFRDVSCARCNAIWQEKFNLVGYDIVSSKTLEEESV